MKKTYMYIAEIRDDHTDELLIRISAYSEESFLEEQGKTKWTEAVKKYEEEYKTVVEDDPDFLQDDKEDLGALIEK